MHSLIERRKTPWLDMPLVFSGNYREYECMLDETWQCDYQQGYWRFWYEADHRYALPTIAFFLAVIIVFTIAYIASHVLPKRVLRTRPMIKTKALFRYLSYRTIRIKLLDWNSAPIGLLMLAAIAMIFFFSMTLGPRPYYWPVTADFGSSPPIATRAGWMGLACMPFVFATAGKANLITFCTGVSHERLQVFHRWISYVFFILALVHTFPFIIYNFQMGMMSDMWNETVFYWTGVVALVAQAWLTFASLSPLRDYFVATGVLFALSWLYRQTRIYFEHGLNHRAELSRTSNGIIRVSIPTKATWTVGQHYFVRFMALGMHAWTIHPFSVCSVSSHDMNLSKEGNELLFYIRPRGGFTSRLADFVGSNPNMKVRVLLDGPYGGVSPKTITGRRRLLVIAGGSGAGWTFPFILDFLKQLPKRESVVDMGPYISLRIILATRELSTVEWFEKEVQQILDSLSVFRTPGLEVEIYYTGSDAIEQRLVTERLPATQNDPEKAHELQRNQGKPMSNSGVSKPYYAQNVQHVQQHDSRPDLATIVAEEARAISQAQDLSVFVCGPLSMQNDVSNIVAQEQLVVAKRGTGDICLHLEHFSWA
ncbi:hypothetical protein TruAng_010755 [Truncatella angustata]|nr:hypothetical protein TruAng_010755 [Truncatella angustata]